MDEITPIRKVVIPLIKDAQDRAEQYVRDYAEMLAKKLAEVGNDFKTLYPYPRTLECGRLEYKRRKAARDFASAFVKHRKGSLRMDEPDLVDVCPERLKSRIEHAREIAAIQYEGFIRKLEGKIGPVATAVLNGNHVWDYSILNVVKVDGTKESWKTKTILNVSPLGTLFNQYPTLRMKKAQF